MFGLFLTLALVDGALLVVIVLLQSGKGDGLAAMGGAGGTMADSILGGRQAATLLTKATWVTGAVFLFLMFALSVMSSRARTPQPLLRNQFNSPAAPQPLLNTDTGAARGAAPPTTPPRTTTTND